MLQKFIRRELGQGVVEFAVIFPLFMILIFAVIDGGLVMGRYGEVNHSAKEGARYAAAGATVPATVDLIKEQGQGILDDVITGCSGDEYICVEYINGPDGEDVGQVGSSVRVKVKYQYDLITPLPNFGGANDWTIESCAVARLERPRQPGGQYPPFGTGAGC